MSFVYRYITIFLLMLATSLAFADTVEIKDV